MSEIEPGYTPDRFPYYEILGELTDEIKRDDLTPTGAYEAFLQRQESARLAPCFDFASTSLVTEAQDRVLGREMSTVSASSTQAARTILSVLDMQGSLEGREVLLTADLGNTEWTQLEYVTFWSLILTGRYTSEHYNDLPTIAAFDERLAQSLRVGGVQSEVIDHNPDPIEYVPEYTKFVYAFVEFMDSLNLTFASSPHRIISLLDSKQSPKGRVERLLGSELGIARQRVVAMRPQAEADEAIPLTRLPDNIEVITAFDERIRIAQAGACLILTRDREPLLDS